MTQYESLQADRMTRDELLVVEPRAAGLDVHKMQITASVRLAVANSPPLAAVRVFPSDPQGLAQLTGWLHGHGVTAATMEGAGVYWEAPYRVLEAAGIQPQLVHAQHVKQIKGRKTDVADSLWLARICQLGLAQPSYVPPPDFSALRQMCRYRRKIVADRLRIRNRIQKTLDREGLRVGGILTGMSCRLHPAETMRRKSSGSRTRFIPCAAASSRSSTASTAGGWTGCSARGKTAGSGPFPRVGRTSRARTRS